MTDFTSNSECQCFPKVTSKQKFFLTKKVGLDNQPKVTSFGALPKHIQQSLGQTSLKKSLKREKRSNANLSNTESAARKSAPFDICSSRGNLLQSMRSVDLKNVR